MDDAIETEHIDVDADELSSVRSDLLDIEETAGAILECIVRLRSELALAMGHPAWEWRKRLPADLGHPVEEIEGFANEIKGICGLGRPRAFQDDRERPQAMNETRTSWRP
ncbi:MAG: hypothetical protein EOQ69_15155 [Mesorhizobium sp.]|nr:MAG: hypothetical protein EOQ69_15155 [Mesorhizobium sp.]